MRPPFAKPDLFREMVKECAYCGLWHDETERGMNMCREQLAKVLHATKALLENERRRNER